MGAFKLLVISTVAATQLLSVVGNFIDIKSQKSSEEQRLDFIDRVGAEFEFSTMLHVGCKVSPLDVVELLFKLNFDG